MQKNALLVSLMLLLSLLIWADQTDEVAMKGQVLTDHRMPVNVSREQSVSFEQIFIEAFETTASTWTVKGEWTVRDASKNPSKQFSSSSFMASSTGPEYENNADDWLISPEVSISHNQEVWLRFREWYQIESHYDFGTVQVSKNGGKNWTVLDSRCGFSDWRESEINLSEYSGSTILIAFQFGSDASFGSQGWLIDEVVLEQGTRDTLAATMTSLNSQDFPMIYSNVAVEFNGEGITTLTQSNFTVQENGVLQTDLFDVFPPTQGGSSRSTDIVFLMDNSGSMSDEQAAVNANVNAFVTNLANAGADVALGLCRFGASQNSGYPIIEDNGILTPNLDYFRTSVWTRNVASGGTERGFDALYVSATSFLFRPGSQKVFIIITDEDSDGGNHTYTSALSALQNHLITLYGMLNTNNSTIIQHYGTIAQVTNGAYYDIYSSFTDILDAISSDVASTYLVKYRSSNPILNGVLRNVNVTVSYNGNQATASGSYMPGSAPEIVRTQATVDLHSQPSWAEGTQFTIAAQITDAMAPFVQSARVYYKCTSHTAFQYVQMTQGAGNIWSANIPASAVQSPGLDYYITATDGQTTSSDPSYQPNVSPYQIGILPNVAPVIIHTPVTGMTLNQPVEITANVTDETNSLASIVLYYRKTGTITYSQATMSAIGDDNYSGSIPESFVTADGVDYYIRAIDDLGVGSIDPLNDYHQIELNAFGFWPNPDGWSFANGDGIDYTATNIYDRKKNAIMWPETWWDQFDYSDNIYPSGWRDWAHSWDFPDWPLFVEAFGQDACYWNPPPGIIVYSPSAVLKWRYMRRKSGNTYGATNWGGSCFGFAVSSLLFFDGYLDLDTEFPNNTDLYDVALTDDSRSMVNMYWIYQFGDEHQQHINSVSDNTPTETLDAVRASFANTSDNIVLSMKNYKLVNGVETIDGGHAVVPYRVAVDSNNSDIHYIYVYDNNDPDEQQEHIAEYYKVVVNTSTNHWSYAPLGWGYSKGLLPRESISQYQTEPEIKSSNEPKFIDGKLRTFMSLYASTANDILISNDTGEQLGFINGGIIENMAAAHPIIVDDPIDPLERPLGYYLSVQDCDIELTAMSDPEMYLSVFQPDKIYMYERFDAQSGQHDQIALDSGLSVSSNDVGNKQLNMEAIKIGLDYEAQYKISNCILGNADAIRMECLSDSLKLQYSGNDSAGSSYNIDIVHVNEVGELNFKKTNINIFNNSTHYISPNWNDLDVLPIHIDDDNDEIIDRTIYVENQYVDPTLPVELSSFSATVTGENVVQLNWVSQSENQMLGYLAYRNNNADQSTAILISPQIIPATNTGSAQAYSTTDTEVESGQTYYYWLEAVDYNSSSYFGPVSVTVNGNTPPVMPEFTELKGAYPNPFRSSTNIEFALKTGESGVVNIYNLSGQIVRKFEVDQGYHKVLWDGKDSNCQGCGSGIYFYQLNTPSYSKTLKMIMIK